MHVKLQQMNGPLREVGDGEKGVLVEDVALEEPLQQVPRHWGYRRRATGLTEGETTGIRARQVAS